MWKRHAVLADAFCGADDRVREAQSVFDGAQAERARTLAAFAVTVGSDAAVAELLGLNEREVRLARRTVGKSDARSLAGTLLSNPSAVAPDIDAATEAASGDGNPMPAPAVNVRLESAQASIPSPRVEQFATRQATPAEPTELRGREWSHARDSLLVDGWNKGMDAAALAAQLGIGLTQLVSRAQSLYASGHLAPVRRDRGRHRRLTDESTRTVETAHTFDRALYASSSENHSWPPPVDTPGQVETAQYAPYSQDGSGFLAPHVDSALGSTGYPVQQRWAHDYPAER
ncbi:hypothetical protein [Streptomyces sp. NBC_00887]|uniref:hypothetical protein n=1 Tax=Streptomyces sp. NBC_00887 TaxID=2975859 RepID=UPI0038676FB4|nr:hypothetical protein OG844_34435 [Streptomyces sp. NBC_00887]